MSLIKIQKTPGKRNADRNSRKKNKKSPVQHQACTIEIHQCPVMKI